jgi:hypothetical protein
MNIEKFAVYSSGSHRVRFSFVHPSSLILHLCFLGCALMLAGCEKDEIRHYRVPHEEPPRMVAAGNPEHAPRRLLGAMLPYKDRVWFFKLLGPPEEIDTLKPTFEQFLQTVRFADDQAKPVTWTLPEGWKEGPGDKMRYAIIRIDQLTPQELTVTALGAGGQASSVQDNIDRWRGQLGLKPASPAELAKDTKELRVGAVTGTLVDISSGAGRAPTAGSARRPLQYTVPAGWKEGRTGGVRVAAFEITEDGRTAEVTVIPFPGDVGGLLENISRWRGQVHLPPINEAEMTRAAQPIQVGGEAGNYVDVTAPESDGASRQRLLGVLAKHDDQTWAFKMIGPVDLVSKHKTEFESFVKSIRFDGAVGAR